MYTCACIPISCSSALCVYTYIRYDTIHALRFALRFHFIRFFFFKVLCTLMYLYRFFLLFAQYCCRSYSNNFSLVLNLTNKRIKIWNCRPKHTYINTSHIIFSSFFSLQTKKHKNGKYINCLSHRLIPVLRVFISFLRRFLFYTKLYEIHGRRDCIKNQI